MRKIILSLSLIATLFALTKEFDGTVEDAILTNSEKGAILVGNKDNYLWYGALNKKAELVVNKISTKSGNLIKIIKFDDGFIVISENGNVFKFNRRMKALWKKRVTKDNVKLVSVTTLNGNIFILGYALIEKYKKFKKEIIIFKLDKNGNSVTEPLILGTRVEDIATDLSNDGKNIFLSGFAKADSLKPFVVALNPKLIKLKDKILDISGSSTNIIGKENILIGNSETNQIFISKSDNSLNKFQTIFLDKNQFIKSAKFIKNSIYIVGYEKDNDNRTYPIIIKTNTSGKIIWKKRLDKKDFIASTIVKSKKGVVIFGYNTHMKSFLYFIKYNKDIK